uniref:Uncharacterized protein n=1 Tax=Arundo donax TaxID=35708 RepID=A0A0A8YK85_ARUDO
MKGSRRIFRCLDGRSLRRTSRSCAASKMRSES